MDFDLFTIVERFFTGVIQALFSVMESYVLLFRRWRTAPRLLLHRYRNPNIRQVGPNTLLVITLLPVALLCTDQAPQVGTIVRRAVADFSLPDDFMRTVIVAMALAVLVDFSLRTYMFARRRRTQSDRVALAKFRMVTLVLIGLPLIFVETALVIAFCAIVDFDFSLLAYWQKWTIVSVFTAVVALAFLRRPALSRTLLLAGATMIFAGVIGDGTARAVNAMQAPASAVDPEASEAIEPTALSCSMAADHRLRVDVVLHNQTRGSRVLDMLATANVRLAGEKAAHMIGLRAVLPAERVRFTVLEPERSVALVFTGEPDAAFAAELDKRGVAGTAPAIRCDVNGLRGDGNTTWKSVAAAP